MTGISDSLKTHLFDCVSVQAKVNRTLIKALEEALGQIEELKDALEDARDPSIHSAIAVSDVSKGDPVVVTKDNSPYPVELTVSEAFVNIKAHICALPENNAATSDSKWKLQYLIRLIQHAYEKSVERVSILEDRVSYQEGETELFKKRWEQLSAYAKELDGSFPDEDDLTDAQHTILGNILKVCA